MIRMFGKFVLPAVCLLAIAMFAPQVKAQQDFTCGGTSGPLGCDGTVTVSGGNYSSSSISLIAAGTWQLPIGSSSDIGQTFVLAFSTSAKTISLTESGGSDLAITGTIDSFTSTSTGASDLLTVNVTWNIPGYASGPNESIHFDIKDGDAYSVDVSIFPTPEPASLLLLGTGLLGMGAMVRRRWAS